MRGLLSHFHNLKVPWSTCDPSIMFLSRRTSNCRRWLLPAAHRSWSVTSMRPSSSVALASIATDQNRDLFEYTSGRWLFNESHRTRERRLVFNVDELKKAVAKCLHQPEYEVKEVFKLAEGGFNRVFQITMNDGSELFARLPYPSTQPNRLAVASEVATLDLLRANDIPVPRVLSYSADVKNPVGSEFIIMEKVPGRPLGSRWFDLSEKQRLKMIYQIVQMEVRLSKLDLPAYGSVFYERDLHAGQSRVVIRPLPDIKGLCIGPDVSLRWWYKERSSLVIDRGSCSSSLQVLSCIAEKELAWLKAFGRPRFPFERAYCECMEYQKSSPEEHIHSLEQYLRIAPHLLPQDTGLHRPILRHPDLQPDNIFVSEDLDIVGVIDWQHCSILPQFLAAGIPKYLQNYQDEESLRFVPPKLPEKLAELDEDERAKALERFRRRHLHFFYLGFTKKFNPGHFEALDRRTDLLTRKTFSHAGEPWEGNNIPLKADLMHLTQVWQKLLVEENKADVEGGNKSMSACRPPICFTQTDREATMKILDQQEETDTQLQSVRKFIGITADGWTSNETYQDSVQRAAFIKQQALADLDTDEERIKTLEYWPFDDFDEGG